MSGILGLFGRRRGGEPPRDDAAADEIVERDEMIRGIRELPETTVREVLVPRTDTVFLAADASAQEILAAFVDSGHSRIPVYRETIDDVVGILYAKDLLAALVGKAEIKAERLMRKPFFVPETKRIDTLLREFKRKRVHIAVVVDEYGGVAGIVCMEDIIEEIVGEIQDEFDDEDEDIARLGPDSWLCDARARLDDINEKLGLELPAEEFDSIGGYVFDLFGRIPHRQESIVTDGISFTVQEMEAHRIISVRLSRIPGEKDTISESETSV